MSQTHDAIAEVLAKPDAWLIEWDAPCEGRTAAGATSTLNTRTQMSVRDAVMLQRHIYSEHRSLGQIAPEHELLADIITIHWARLRPVTRYIVEAYSGDSLQGAECADLAAAHSYVVGLFAKYESLDDRCLGDFCAAVGDDAKFQELFEETKPDLAGQYGWAPAKGAS